MSEKTETGSALRFLVRIQYNRTNKVSVSKEFEMTFGDACWSYSSEDEIRFCRVSDRVDRVEPWRIGRSSRPFCLLHW